MSIKEIKKIIDYCLSYNLDYAEVFFESTREFQIDYNKDNYFNKKNYICGISIIIRKNELSFFRVIEYIELPKIYAIIDEICLELNLEKIENTHRNFKKINNTLDKNSKLTYIEKKNILKTISTKILNRKYLLSDIKNSIFERNQDIIVANSTGIIVKMKRYYIRVLTNIIMSNDDKYFKSFDGTNKTKFLSDSQIDNYCNNILDNLNQRYFSKKIDSGTYDILFDNNCGIVFHEILGHIFEYETYLKGIDINYDKIFNKQITLIDDAGIKDLFGSYEYDDEGNNCKKTVLIKNGKIKDFLYSNFFKNSSNIHNGRRQSYNFFPTSRMSNTYIKPGNSKCDKVLKKINNGIFVNKIKKGEMIVDKNQFYILIDTGYIIKNGKKISSFKDLEIYCDINYFIKNIAMVCSDLKFNSLMCNASSGWIPVTFGCPSILVKNIRII